MRPHGDPLLAGAPKTGAHVLLLNSQMLTARDPGVNVGGVLRGFQYALAKIAVLPGLPETRSSPSSRSKGNRRIVAFVSSFIFCSVSSVPSQGATTNPRFWPMISANS